MMDFFLAPKTKNIASPHFFPGLLCSLILMMKPNKKKLFFIIKPQYSIISSCKQSRCLADKQWSFVHLELPPPHKKKKKKKKKKKNKTFIKNYLEQLSSYTNLPAHKTGRKHWGRLQFGKKKKQHNTYTKWRQKKTK